MVSISVYEVFQQKVGELAVSNSVIRQPENALDIMRPYLENRDREYFIVLLLNTKNMVNALHVVSIGSLNAAIAHPREVFKLAILHNAAGIICGHNHPSGDPTPSPEDIQLTERLMKAGELIGIEIMDHIIIGGDTGRFTSLKKQGLM